MTKEKLSVLYRIEQRLEPQPNGCLLWTGCKDGYGYGMIWAFGRSRRVHAVLYEICHGNPPKGMDVDHMCHRTDACAGGMSCSHRRCCNIVHLRLLTRADNIARGWHRTVAGQAACAQRQRDKTHCPAGHPYVGENVAICKKDGSRRCRQCDREYARRKKGIRHPRKP